MNRLFPHTIIAAAIIAAPIAVQAANTYETGRLKNGLQYHVLTVPSEPGRIDVRLQVGVGASDEDGKAEIGAAHMVEHMVFRRAPDYPDGVGDTLIAQGWRRGANFNAMTNYERTLYMFSPNQGKSQLEETLKALSAMMSPHEFSEADWQKEKQIIMNEWRGGQGLNERMNRKRAAILRNGSRQSRYAIIGTPESIENTPVSVLQDFHRRWYVPNNMHIMISGDIKPAQARALIEKHFGGLKAGSLPDRGGAYYEPVLKKGWHTAQLQDKGSGGSHVMAAFRLDDSIERDFQTEAGRKARLIERIASKILAERVKNQKPALPKAVSNITLRKSDIGRHTTAVALFATVSPDGHNAGLDEILKLRAQLLAEPVSQKEFDDYLGSLKKTIASAKKKTTLPEPFGDAIQTVSENAFAGKPVRTQAENAALVEALLPQITPADITARIRSWLDADDKLVQFQAPGLAKVDIPAAADIAARAEKSEKTKQPPLLAAAPPSKGEFADQSKAGKILSETRDKKLNITRWTLQNGDKVIVWQHPAVKGTTHIQTISSAGFMQKNLLPWQAQTGAQLVWQSGPQGFTPPQLDAWKKQHKINLSQDIKATYGKTAGSAPDKNFADLLHLYHAYAATPQADDGYRDAIAQMVRQIPLRETSDRAAREAAVSQLRYGRRDTYPAPDQEQLEEIEPQDLLAYRRAVAEAPAAHYILTARPAAELKPAVSRYLAAIPRRKAEAAADILPPAGAKEERAPVGAEQGRSDVAVWSFAQTEWSPETAAAVSLLHQLAYEQLKAELRDKELGVYSLKFDSTLNPDTGRVESSLRFTTTPERAEKLWKLAEQVLQKLPETVSEPYAAQARKRLAEAEKGRLKQPETLLNRLVLSETHYGDARYPAEMARLPERITRAKLQQAAKLMWQPQNRRVLIIDPQTGK